MHGKVRAQSFSGSRLVAGPSTDRSGLRDPGRRPRRVSSEKCAHFLWVCDAG